MYHTNFREHCDQASSELRELSQVMDAIDTNLLKYESSKNNTALLTSIVKDLRRANELAQQIKFGHVPFLKDEDRAISEAIEIAVDGLVRRINGARDDLEVVTHTTKTSSEEPKYLSVRPTTRFSPVS